MGTRSRTPLPESHFLGLSDVRAKWAREEAVTPGSPPGGRATLSGAAGPPSREREGLSLSPFALPAAKGALSALEGESHVKIPTALFPLLRTFRA